MDTFGTNELQRLLDAPTGPCVSILMPAHATSDQGRQDPVRLKNLLQQAEEILSDGWLRHTDARELLQTAGQLPGDSDLWANRSHGLAVFIGPNTFEHYRVPLTLEEQLFVGHYFYVKPLVPLVTDDGRFLILGLSQKNVRLFAASRHSIDRVDVPNMPPNIDDALNYTEVDKGLQVHMGARGGRGKQSAIFHGQGGEADTHKEDLKQFFRMVDAAVEPIWRRDASPVLLAGVEYLLPLYREISTCSKLVDAELTGNCDYQSDTHILERAWPLIQPVIEQARNNAVAKYHELAGTGKATADLRELLSSAQQGRVQTLFVDNRAVQWGAFDPQSARVELHDSPQVGDDDLLNLAVVQTLSGRGTVYSVGHDEVPSGELVAATCRY